ncbi:Pleiotropic drug resistance protein 4 [Hordeum vulgare]|nr:Pleiotropic drug resistance protein 4 [Hordeum vulgare]
MWSRDRVDLFSRSRSSWDEDDEEALRWAALEKLPTYDRARTAVLAMPEWEIKEANTDKLGVQQRIASDDDDHECFLSKFKDLVEWVWIELPTIEVRYENLYGYIFFLEECTYIFFLEECTMLELVCALELYNR